MAFRTAVELLSNDFRIAMLTRLFPGWLLKPAPARIQRVGEAHYYYEFGNYLRELLKGEERAPSENENLFSALNHSNEAGRKAQGTGITDSELVGNVFLFALAGYETTSVVLKYVASTSHSTGITKRGCTGRWTRISSVCRRILGNGTMNCSEN